MINRPAIKSPKKQNSLPPFHLFLPSSNVYINLIITKIWLFVLAAVFLSGCAGVVKHDSSYVHYGEVTKFKSALQNAVLFTDPADDVQIVERPPSHVYFYGDQKIALGEILRLISTDIYGKAMDHGAISRTNNIDSAAAYKIHPRVKDFTYGFRKEGSGNLFHPNIAIVIEVSLVDKNNDLLFSKSYPLSLSGGASLGGDHAAAIRKLTHDAIYKIIIMSVADINTAQEKAK